MRILSLVVLVLVTASADAQTKVGSTCEYSEYPGTCTVTSVDPDGTVHFTYEGAIDGEAVTLAENTAISGGAVGTQVDCTLQFITQGTCTPCVISIGSCGTEAWEAYTLWAATQAVGSGCSLSAR